MEKEKRNSLCEMYNLLSDAVVEVERLLKEGAVEDAFSLLSQLQESAVLIGNTIESLCGEGSDSVGTLEDLCEQVYVFSEGLQYGNDSIATLSQSLNNCLSVFEKEFPPIKEVVFLPCSHELWDGFDALYKELANRSGYDVRVIPIPWFDKNGAGNFDIENPHFDTTSYPAYVKLTAFDKYDFGKRHPDTIYIQNAFDSSNLGGSVHPAFYTENLKKFTDELVYIPHYIFDETNINNKNTQMKLSDYLVIPGIEHIDRIVIQSENLKLAMLYLFAGEDDSEFKKKLDEKISFDGFPRMKASDEIQQTEIPSSWKPFILRADGSRKKVILYCNSIQTLLDQNVRLLTKIKHSFETFKESSDKIALIWRPHPLLSEVADFLRPEIASDFKDLISYYNESGIGILDDTTDPTTAISLSDAYYGDPGSVMELFKATGKPIMIENTDVL